jgi:hypothetical protein
MKTRLGLGIVIVLLTAATTGLHASAESPLTDVLGFVPTDVREPSVFFTNWAQLKALIGLENVTSRSPLELRLELMERTSQDQAAASAYGMSHFRQHAEAWGWDTADLDWEANIISYDMGPAYILKLREDFDFVPVAERFEARGFVQTESYGALIYTHELDLRADWARTTELSIHRTAYIEEDNLLILSSYLGAVKALLAAHAGELTSLSGNPFAVSAVEHLGEPAAATLLFGAGQCLRFTANPLLDLLGTIPDEERIAQLRAEFEERQLLVPYRVFAVGYHYENGHPIGTLVFEYDAAELAEMDLPAREAVAKEGMSDSSEAPIAESIFTVLDTQVQDSAVILRVSPVNGQPRRLFRMVFYFDAPFAGCSS